MSKGKRKVNSEEEEDEEHLTHTLADLAEQAGPRGARRYTTGQFTDGIIGLVRRENVNDPNADPTACEECLEMAINRTPCPHGTFPLDGRPRPTLVWPYNSPPDALSEASFRGSEGSSSTTPTPSTVRGTNTQPAPTHFTCPRGHPHSTREKAARCAARHGASSAGMASSDSGALRPSSVGSASRYAPPTSFGGVYPSGVSRSASQAEASTRVAPAPTTMTGHDWFGTRRRAALLSGASPHGIAPPSPHAAPPSPHAAPPSPHAAPPSPHATPPSPHATPPSPYGASPPPVPASPLYIAHIHPYDASVELWYVVTVGSRIGVFSQQWQATNATYRVSGQQYRHYISYDEAVKAFRSAEAAGAVFQRHPKY